MLRRNYFTGTCLESSEAWSSVSFSSQQKLFKLHSFLFVKKGKSYSIEIQEGIDGGCEAYASNTADPNDAIPSIHGSNLKASLQSMISQLEGRP